MASFINDLVQQAKWFLSQTIAWKTWVSDTIGNLASWARDIVSWNMLGWWKKIIWEVLDTWAWLAWLPIKTAGFLTEKLGEWLDIVWLDTIGKGIDTAWEMIQWLADVWQTSLARAFFKPELNIQLPSYQKSELERALLIWWVDQWLELAKQYWIATNEALKKQFSDYANESRVFEEKLGSKQSSKVWSLGVLNNDFIKEWWEWTRLLKEQFDKELKESIEKVNKKAVEIQQTQWFTQQQLFWIQKWIAELNDALTIEKQQMQELLLDNQVKIDNIKDANRKQEAIKIQNVALNDYKTFSERLDNISSMLLDIWASSKWQDLSPWEVQFLLENNIKSMWYNDLNDYLTRDLSMRNNPSIKKASETFWLNAESMLKSLSFWVDQIYQNDKLLDENTNKLTWVPLYWRNTARNLIWAWALALTSLAWKAVWAIKEWKASEAWVDKLWLVDFDDNNNTISTFTTEFLNVAPELLTFFSTATRVKPWNVKLSSNSPLLSNISKQIIQTSKLVAAWIVEDAVVDAFDTRTNSDLQFYFNLLTPAFEVMPMVKWITNVYRFDKTFWQTAEKLAREAKALEYEQQLLSIGRDPVQAKQEAQELAKEYEFTPIEFESIEQFQRVYSKLPKVYDIITNAAKSGKLGESEKIINLMTKQAYAKAKLKQFYDKWIDTLTNDEKLYLNQLWIEVLDDTLNVADIVKMDFWLDWDVNILWRKTNLWRKLTDTMPEYIVPKAVKEVVGDIHPKKVITQEELDNVLAKTNLTKDDFEIREGWFAIKDEAFATLWGKSTTEFTNELLQKTRDINTKQWKTATFAKASTKEDNLIYWLSDKRYTDDFNLENAVFLDMKRWQETNKMKASRESIRNNSYELWNITSTDNINNIKDWSYVVVENATIASILEKQIKEKNIQAKIISPDAKNDWAFFVENWKLKIWAVDISAKRNLDNAINNIDDEILEQIRNNKDITTTEKAIDEYIKLKYWDDFSEVKKILKQTWWWDALLWERTLSRILNEIENVSIVFTNPETFRATLLKKTDEEIQSIVAEHFEKLATQMWFEIDDAIFSSLSKNQKIELYIKSLYATSPDDLLQQNIEVAKLLSWSFEVKKPKQNSKVIFIKNIWQSWYALPQQSVDNYLNTKKQDKRDNFIKSFAAKNGLDFDEASNILEQALTKSDDLDVWYYFTYSYNPYLVDLKWKVDWKKSVNKKAMSAKIEKDISIIKKTLDKYVSDVKKAWNDTKKIEELKEKMVQTIFKFEQEYLYKYYWWYLSDWFVPQKWKLWTYDPNLPDASFDDFKQSVKEIKNAYDTIVAKVKNVWDRKEQIKNIAETWETSKIFISDGKKSAYESLDNLINHELKQLDESMWEVASLKAIDPKKLDNKTKAKLYNALVKINQTYNLAWWYVKSAMKALVPELWYFFKNYILGDDGLPKIVGSKNHTNILWEARLSDIQDIEIKSKIFEKIWKIYQSWKATAEKIRMIADNTIEDVMGKEWILQNKTNFDILGEVYTDLFSPYTFLFKLDEETLKRIWQKSLDNTVDVVDELIDDFIIQTPSWQVNIKEKLNWFKSNRLSEYFPKWQASVIDDVLEQTDVTRNINNMKDKERIVNDAIERWIESYKAFSSAFFQNVSDLFKWPNWSNETKALLYWLFAIKKDATLLANLLQKTRVFKTVWDKTFFAWPRSKYAMNENRWNIVLDAYVKARDWKEIGEWVFNDLWKQMYEYMSRIQQALTDWIQNPELKQNLSDIINAPLRFRKNNWWIDLWEALRTQSIFTLVDYTWNSPIRYVENRLWELTELSEFNRLFNTRYTIKEFNKIITWLWPWIISHSWILKFLSKIKSNFLVSFAKRWASFLAWIAVITTQYWTFLKQVEDTKAVVWRTWETKALEKIRKKFGILSEEFDLELWGVDFTNLWVFLNKEASVTLANNLITFLDKFSSNANNLADIIFASTFKNLALLDWIKNNSLKQFNSAIEFEQYIKTLDETQQKKLLNAVEARAEETFATMISVSRSSVFDSWLYGTRWTIIKILQSIFWFRWIRWENLTKRYLKNIFVTWDVAYYLIRNNFDKRAIDSVITELQNNFDFQEFWYTLVMDFYYATKLKKIEERNDEQDFDNFVDFIGKEFTDIQWRIEALWLMSRWFAAVQSSWLIRPLYNTLEEATLWWSVADMKEVFYRSLWNAAFGELRFLSRFIDMWMSIAWEASLDWVTQDELFEIITTSLFNMQTSMLRYMLNDKDYQNWISYVPLSNSSIPQILWWQNDFMQIKSEIDQDIRSKRLEEKWWDIADYMKYFFENTVLYSIYARNIAPLKDIDKEKMWNRFWFSNWYKDFIREIENNTVATQWFNNGIINIQSIQDPINKEFAYDNAWLYLTDPSLAWSVGSNWTNTETKLLYKYLNGVYTQEERQKIKNRGIYAMIKIYDAMGEQSARERYLYLTSIEKKKNIDNEWRTTLNEWYNSQDADTKEKIADAMSYLEVSRFLTQNFDTQYKALKKIMKQSWVSEQQKKQVKQSLIDNILKDLSRENAPDLWHKWVLWSAIQNVAMSSIYHADPEAMSKFFTETIDDYWNKKIRFNTKLQNFASRYENIMLAAYKWDFTTFKDAFNILVRDYWKWPTKEATENASAIIAAHAYKKIEEFARWRNDINWDRFRNYILDTNESLRNNPRLARETIWDDLYNEIVWYFRQREEKLRQELYEAPQWWGGRWWGGWLRIWKISKTKLKQKLDKFTDTLLKFPEYTRWTGEWWDKYRPVRHKQPDDFQFTFKYREAISKPIFEKQPKKDINRKIAYQPKKILTAKKLLTWQTK